jgi:hypothetical protein
LHYYGIQGTVTKWFRFYLTDRKQKTEIKSLQKFSSNWRTIKHGSSPVVNGRALLFIIYINYLPPTINTLSKSILFTDDITVIISTNNFYGFSSMSNTFLSHVSEWFTPNKKVLNLDKTTVMKFITNKSPQYDLNTGYNEKYIEESINIRSLVYKLIT